MQRNALCTTLVTLAALMTGCAEGAYDEVVVSGNGRVDVEADERKRSWVDLDCSPGRDDIAPEVRDGVLYLDLRDADCDARVHHNVGVIRRDPTTDRGDDLVVVLGDGADLARLEGENVFVRTTGSGDVRIDEFIASTASVEADGDASVRIRALDAAVWDVWMRGSSDLMAAGRVDRTLVDLRGNALLDAEDVVSDEAYGTVGGNAEALLTVDDVADVEVFGSAEVQLLDAAE